MAGKSHHSISFLNENPWVKSLAGGSHHLVSIFNQNPHLMLRSHHLGSIFGWIFHFRAMEGDKYHATCFFQAIKGRSTQVKCKQNMRNMQETCKIIQPMITHLWHLSPLLLWDWEWCSLCKINEYTYCKSNLRKTDFYNIGKNIRLLVLSPLISTFSIKLNKGNNDARWIQFSDNKYSQRKARSL